MSDLGAQLIGEEEGPSSPTVYKDTRGYDTIARAVLVQSGIPGAGLTPDELAFIDARRMLEAQHIAAGYPFFSQMNTVRQAVLVSVSFQLGLAPLHWPNFMAAAKAQDYPAMAAAGLDSVWAKGQTPRRALREMTMLQTGNWVEHT